eukprot:364831-Chlamydomonas_euryale.AAC.4
MELWGCGTAAFWEPVHVWIPASTRGCEPVRLCPPARSTPSHAPHPGATAQVPDCRRRHHARAAGTQARVARDAQHGQAVAASFKRRGAAARRGHAVLDE